MFRKIISMQSQSIFNQQRMPHTLTMSGDVRVCSTPVQVIQRLTKETEQLKFENTQLSQLLTAKKLNEPKEVSRSKYQHPVKIIGQLQKEIETLQSRNKKLKERLGDIEPARIARKAR